MKFNNIIKSLLGVALVAGAWSCTDEVSYDPTPKYDGDQVYFSSDDHTTISITEGATSFSFPLHRYAADGELTVGLVGKVTNSEGVEMNDVFSIPTQVTFPADAKVVEVPVGVVFTSIVPAEKYTFSVSVAGEAASPYGQTSQVFKLSYDPWTEWTEYSSEDGSFQMAGLWDYLLEDKIEVRKSTVDPSVEQYRFPGPIPDEVFDFVISVDYKKTIKVDDVDVPLVTLDKVDFGDVDIDGSKTPSYMQDVVKGLMTLAGWNMDTALAFCAQNDMMPSYFDVDKGLFYLNIIFWNDATAAEGRFYGPFMNYMQLPGFADYEINFTVAGNFVDSEGVESVILNAYKSDDVYAYAYSIEEGTLTEAEVEAVAEAIAANPDATLYRESLTTIKFQPEKSGKYTVVAVGFDQANQKVYTTSSVFEFTSVKSEDSFETIGFCLYRDGFIDAFFEIPFVAWEVEVQEDKNNPGYYRLVDPYKEWPVNVSNGGKYVLPGKYYLEVDATDPNYVRVAESEIGVQIDPEAGAFSAWCAGDLLLAAGKYTEDQIKQAGYYGKMKDGVITFDPGTLVAAMSKFRNGAYFNSNIDLDNPANQEDFDGEYDPFWGTNGPFMVDLSDIAPAKAKQQKLPANMQCKEKANKAFAGQKNANAKQGVVVKNEELGKLGYSSRQVF